MSLANITRLLLLLQLLLSLGVAWLAFDKGGYSGLLSLSLGMVIFLLPHPVIIALEFGLSQWVGRRFNATAPLSLAGWLRCYIQEVWYSWRTFTWMSPFQADRPLASAPDDSQATPLLLIHGYFCNRGFLWHAAARQFSAAGHPVSAVSLEPVWGSIDDYADMIGAAIDDLSRRCGQRQVALVCHSMGGLAARAAIQKKGHAKIKAVVTLGTPHLGTALARFGHGRNSRQMRFGSDWISQLSGSGPIASQPPLIPVLTRHDNIVAPQSLQFPLGTSPIVFDGVGHIALAFSRPVLNSVIAAITRT